MRAALATAALLAAAAVALAESPEGFVQRGQAAFQANGCYGCHTIGRAGTPIGPDLSRVGARFPPEYLARWLRDPAEQRPHAHMPALELSEADLQALVVYLGTLR